MRICRLYADVCRQMEWSDHYYKCAKLHDEIINQQSTELKQVENK